MSDAWDEVEEAVELLQTGELDAAVDELRGVLRRSPANEHAHHFLGTALFELSRYDEALPCFVRALSIAPQHRGAMAAAAHTLRMLGKFDLAIRMAEGLLAIAAEDTDALHVLGTSHYALGEVDKAREFLQRFLKSGPELEAVWEAQSMLAALEETPSEG